MNIDVFTGVMIPFFGTALGASFVLFMKREFNFFICDFLSAVAGGIMTAASVWSLIIPATEYSAHMGRFAFLPCSLGIAFGCLFMIALSKLSDLIFSCRLAETAGYKNINTFIAVTIHNIPEGMAVGCVFASALVSDRPELFAVAMTLAVGIAVQNVPEGAVISMPVYASGTGKAKAFISGALSGVVEPLGAVAALVMAKSVEAVLPWFLSFAAGAMFFVVAQELLNEIRYKGKVPIVGIGFTLGFTIMMSLDIALA